MKRRPDFVLPELGISPHIGSNTTYFVDGDDDYLWYNNAAMAGGRRIKLKRDVGDYKMSPVDTIFYTNSPLSTFDSPALGTRVINNAAVSGGRKPVFRQKRKIRSHPLTFRNPFYSTGAKIRIPERSFSRPIRGLSTIGDYANTLRGEPLSSVYNQPLLDRTPQYKGAHSQWTSLIPKGVNSVEARDRRLTAQREIEAQHAGVYSKKEQKMRALQRMMKDWMKAKDMKKVMQMLTEHDELGGIPKKSKEQAKKLMEGLQKNLVTSSKRYLDLMHENDSHPPITTQAMPGAQPAQTPAEAKEQREEEKTTLEELVRGQARDQQSAEKAVERANDGSDNRTAISEFGDITTVKPNVGVGDPTQLLGIYAEPLIPSAPPYYPMPSAPPEEDDFLPAPNPASKPKEVVIPPAVKLPVSKPKEVVIPSAPNYPAPSAPVFTREDVLPSVPKRKFADVRLPPDSVEDTVLNYFKLQRRNKRAKTPSQKTVLAWAINALEHGKRFEQLTVKAKTLYNDWRIQDQEKYNRVRSIALPDDDDDLTESHFSLYDDSDVE